MQNYQPTLGQGSMQQHPSRSSFQSLQKEPSTASSAQSDEQQDQQLPAASRQGSYKQSGVNSPLEASSKTLSPSRQGSSALAAPRQGSSKLSGPTSNSLDEAALNSLTYLRKGSAALSEERGLISAVQSAGPQMASEQGSLAALVQANHQKGVTQHSQPAVSGIARESSVADRLKAWRGMMDNDVEPEGFGGDNDIQEDLPMSAAPEAASFGYLDEPIREEVQQES